MRTSQGNKVVTYQNELKPMSRSLRRRNFHWTGSKGRPRRLRTGQPLWFKQMKEEMAYKVILSKLPIGELVKHGICSIKQANNLQEAGFTTVWSLVRASYKDLLKIPSFGPKTLAKLWQDAKIKGNLSLKWSPDGR